MTFLATRPATAWLAMCFGVCLPTDYQTVPDRELAESKTSPKRHAKPTTSWRELPLVAKYDLVKQIGKGGFSEIWLAERRDGGVGDGGVREKVALKVVGLSDPDLEEEEVSNLIAEARFLRNLDCPYIVKCYETESNHEWLVMALEYITGGEMLDRIHKVKKYTEAEAAKMFAQIVSAVSYLHNLNLIHRDIKPENVMFTSPVEELQAEGLPLRVKIIDLGMATLYDPKKPIKGCVGTPGFVAPELWHDAPHTPACDIYSLGAVLFIMLTGRKPHSGPDIRCMTYCNKSIKEAPGLQDERFLALSPSARELLLAMLADDPRVRPSCMEVLRHPFITAVDSNAEAHREMSIEVRRRMWELAQLRRVHGLRYALRVHKPQEGDHLDFLKILDQRRLKLKGDGNNHFGRASEFGRASDFGRPSYADFKRPSSAESSSGVGSGAGGAAPCFARSSLGASYLQQPAMLLLSQQPLPGAITTSATTKVSAAAAATGADSASPSGFGSGTAVSPGRSAFASVAAATPFARISQGSSARGGGSGGSSAAPAPPPLQTILSSSLQEEQLPPLAAPTAAAASAAASAAPPPPQTSAFASIDSNGVATSTSQHASRRQMPLDPMAIVNALPTLHHCASADELMLANMRIDEDTRAVDGGSPVATAAMVEQAMLTRCLSANPDLLELLGRQHSLRRTLEQLQLATPDVPADLEALRAAVMGSEVKQLQPTPEAEQEQRQGTTTGVV